MDNSLIIFAYGFAAACIIAAISLPVFWRVAVRFTKRDISATSPVNAKEVSALQDLLRAKFAILIRQLENRIQDLQQQASQYWFELENARNRIAKLVNSPNSSEKMLESQSRKEIQHQDSNPDNAHVATEYMEAGPKVSELENSLANSQTEVSRLKDALADEKNRQKELDVKLADLTRQLNESEEIRDVLEAQVRKAESKMENLDGASAVAEESAPTDQTSQELIKAKSDIQSLNEKLSQTEGVLKNAQIELVQLKSKLELTRVYSAEDTETTPIPGDLKDLERQIAKAKADRNELKVANAALEARISAFAGQDPGANSLEHTRKRLDMFAAQFASVAATLEGKDSEVLKLLEQDSPNQNGSTTTLADKIRILMEKQGNFQESPHETGDNEKSRQTKNLQ